MGSSELIQNTISQAAPPGTLNCMKKLQLLVTQLYPTLCNLFWTIARQTLLSIEFCRQDPGVGCHSLLQRIFPIH